MRFLKHYSAKTWFLAVFFFLLPWQTRWIYGETLLGGFATEFGVLSLYATEVLLLAGALVSFFRRRDRPVIDASYRLPLALSGLVFLAAAASLLATSDLAVSLNALVHLGSAMIVFMMVLDRNIHLKPILCAFGAGLIAPFLLGVWQIVFDASPASTIFGLAERNAETLGDSVTIKNGVRELRAYGSFSHPNVFGGYLAVGMLAFRALLVEKVSVVQRQWLLAGMLLLTVALVFAASRSAILGLALGVGLVALVSYLSQKPGGVNTARKLMVPIAVAVIAVALAGTFFAPNLFASLRGGGVAEDRSLDERIEQYRDYPMVVGLQWLTGVGLGTYAFATFDAGECTTWDCQPIHNVLLLILAEIGIIGIIVVLAWSSSIDKINYARFPSQHALMAFAMGNVVLVVLFFDHYLWSSWSGLALLAFVMALTVRMGENEHS